MPSLNRYLSAAVMIAVLTAFASADDQTRPTNSLTLFGDDSTPLLLSSERGWMPIGTVDWDTADIPSLMPGETRKWRLESSYEHERAGGQATVQIRLRGAESAPTFTHPWSEGTDTRAVSYSNWYESEDSAKLGRGKELIEVRLVAPPRRPLTGKLYSVVLETWDTADPNKARQASPSAPNVQLAYVKPLPTVRNDSGPSSRADFDAVDPDLSPRAALTFALSFVESCLLGDLPSYYRLQADPVRSLDDGTAIAKYRLNPPTGIPGVASLEDYKRRFDYKIYPAETFAQLFPEWFDEQRPWRPGENSWLFMGRNERFSGFIPENLGYLVFLIEPDDHGEWRVVARPGGGN